ncbi:MAG: hypothetical protein OXE92_04155 [Bacteroidetes bacterium]|nr:hypothetical protein [Bacteroidota bacterium]MCY4204902.1 hypothetical protein [Bacteroidota bacterium]
MIARKRKGMIIKNANKKAISVKLQGREIEIPPGGTATVTSQEVMDNALRDLLQVRDLAIVRPLTDKEEKEIQKEFGHKTKSGKNPKRR